MPVLVHKLYEFVVVNTLTSYNRETTFNLVSISNLFFVRQLIKSI